MKKIEIQKEPKDRILEAATHLFALKGFADVGVREIARDADVNVSMISYYYSGKVGILKSIIEEYFHELENIIISLKSEILPPPAKLRLLVKKMIEMMIVKSDLCQVAHIMLPINVPEFMSIKKKLVLANDKLMQETFHRGENVYTDPIYQMIIGPAFTSLIFSHFNMRNILNEAYEDFVFDEKFYDQYSEIISNLFLNGMSSLAQKFLGRLSSHPDSIEINEHTVNTLKN